MKYYRHEAGEGGWSGWSRPVQGNEDVPAEQFYKLSCCDCGLAHDIDFRVTGQGMVFRVRRNNRATGQVRRHLIKPGHSLVLHKRGEESEAA